MKALGVGLGAFAFHDVEVVSAAVGRAVARPDGAGRGPGRRPGRRRLAAVAHPHLERVAQAVAVAL